PEDEARVEPARRKPLLELSPVRDESHGPRTYTQDHGKGGEATGALRGSPPGPPPGDAADPALRGEGRGAVPRGRASGLPARRDRAGGRRGRRVRRDGGRRCLRLDPPGPRPYP